MAILFQVVEKVIVPFSVFLRGLCGRSFVGSIYFGAKFLDKPPQTYLHSATYVTIKEQGLNRNNYGKNEDLHPR